MSKPKIEVASYKGRRRYVWLKALLALVLAGALAFCALLAAVLFGAHDDVEGDPGVMIVLGCQVREDGPSVLLQDRLDKALDYLAGRPDLTVVVSGGQGADEPVSEARCMYDYLTAHGVPGENILLEERSHNTWENLRYAKQLLEERGLDGEGVAIVSNGFHLTRVALLAQRAGFGEVSLLAAPSSHIPSRLAMYVREPAALVKSFVFDR